MIIKSHIRGGFRQMANYLKDKGENEKIRTVETGTAANLDEAFQDMWAVASQTRAKKPLHHISINPFRDERLTDKQVLKIVERCEKKYGYKPGEHQRVIVEHIKDGRQHFHVVWNRVSMKTRRTIWPGHHWKKSKQVCREMEKELGLKRPLPKFIRRTMATLRRAGKLIIPARRIQKPKTPPKAPTRRPRRTGLHGPLPRPQRPQTYFLMRKRRRKKGDENIPDSEKASIKRAEMTMGELYEWAKANGRVDILFEFFGIDDQPEP